MPLPDSSEDAALPDRSSSLPRLDGDDVMELLSEATTRVLRRRFRVVRLVRQAYERMTTHSSVLSAVWEDLKTMMRLLLRWADRSYKHVSWTPLFLIAGALMYFVAPLDVVPDALGAIGFLDDVTVIATVVERLRGELEQFRAWERTRLSE